MWYVTNNKNNSKLKKFEENVIIPFFEELIHYKKIGFSGNFYEYFKVSSNCSNISHYNIFRIIANRKINKLKLSQCMDNIVADFSIYDINYYYTLYKSQNSQLYEGKKNITFESIPNPFTTIFIDYFYSKFFNDEKIWTFIDGERFSREVFHENFKQENGLFVCPYCDLDTIISNGNNQIEHFFPKSKYPFLSMNALNLISSCSSCNMPHEGKGANILSPITSPFNEQIGDNIEFELDLISQKIVISTTLAEVENYLSLLKLKSRYEKNRAFEFLLHRGESLYCSLVRYEIEKSTLINSDDITNIIRMEKANDKKNIPLYFATISIFSDYEKYNAAKKGSQT